MSRERGTIESTWKVVLEKDGHERYSQISSEKSTRTCMIILIKISEATEVSNLSRKESQKVPIKRFVSIWIGM